MKLFICISMMIMLCPMAMAGDSPRAGYQVLPERSPSTPVLASQACECGDVNCDGVLNLGDAAHLLSYLFNGGPPPLTDDLSFAEWDSHEILTISDVYCNVMHVFTECDPVCPPPNPPLDPEIDSTISLYYTDSIPSGVGSAVISLTLNSGGVTVPGLSIPVKIRVDGEVPTIDSVVFPDDPNFLAASVIYADSGCVAIGGEHVFGFQFITRIALIYLSVPATPDEKDVTVEWINLAPVQAPTPDSTIIPMILSGGLPGYAVEPLLIGHCCSNPGDANEDGAVNIGDAVWIINCIFKTCTPPFCLAHWDANCDGTPNIGDAVYLVNYVFKGGPPPCCL